MEKLEQQFDLWFVKKAPLQLPENSKQALVKYMPWLTLAGGVLTALAVLNLYRFALWAQDLGKYTQELNTYGYVAPAATTMTPLVWVSLAVLAVEATLFFIAFPALKARKKSGWNLLFYVAIANVIYALAYLFADQNIGSFIFSLISSTIGLYLLFQIRDHYLAQKVSPAADTSAGSKDSSTTKPATKV